jgi:transposase-like protein
LSTLPKFCPYQKCRSHSLANFSAVKKGKYQRKCDGRWVQRFQCHSCCRKFSTQSFRFTFRLHKPLLRLQLFALLNSKVTLRQAARVLGCSRHTVERLARKMAITCRDFHELQLRLQGKQLRGVFQLDELESFEGDRSLCPITVPVLIERKSYFVLHTDVAPMGPRGRLNPRARGRLETYLNHYPKRENQSRLAVAKSLLRLRELLADDSLLHLQTDRKVTYKSLAKQIFPGRIAVHVRGSSKTPRTYGNVLFPINHTLAMMRDGISRLVRRSWGVSKNRNRLNEHMAIWMVYRNYSRGITVKSPNVTPAMALGICPRPILAKEILSARWPLRN